MAISKVPLKLQVVLETIVLDYYNHKYGDKKPKNKKNQEKIHQIVHRNTNRSHIRTTHESKRPTHPTRRRYQTEIATFAENRTGPKNTYARHGEHNAIIARRCQSVQIENRQPCT